MDLKVANGVSHLEVHSHNQQTIGKPLNFCCYYG